MARGIRIEFDGKTAGSQFKRSMQRNAKAVREASRETAVTAAAQITDEGRSDITQAGNFGQRWTEGFQAALTEGGGHILIRVTMAVPYWTVFQDGKVIQGKPLLWIPLSFAADAKGVRARDYPGQLFRVERLGKAPLLMTKVGNTAEAKYFGKEEVTIPKKFHLREIVERIARDLGRIYRNEFKTLGRG